MTWQWGSGRVGPALSDSQVRALPGVVGLALSMGQRQQGARAPWHLGPLLWPQLSQSPGPPVHPGASLLPPSLCLPSPSPSPQVGCAQVASAGRAESQTACVRWGCRSLLGELAVGRLTAETRQSWVPRWAQDRSGPVKPPCAETVGP